MNYFIYYVKYVSNLSMPIFFALSNLLMTECLNVIIRVYLLKSLKIKNLKRLYIIITKKQKRYFESFFMHKTIL